MRFAVCRIDRALRDLYRLDSSYSAENFLIENRPRIDATAANARFEGALFVREIPSSRQGREISVGIYLSESVRQQLDGFSRWSRRRWTHAQLSAFTTAVEEVSHFHYLLFHRTLGRPVSQLELEVQGDVDKFVVTYFALAPRLHVGLRRRLFNQLFDRLFFCFRLHSRLNHEERQRYLEANSLARRYIRKQMEQLSAPIKIESFLKDIRKFYRASSSEKLSLIGT